MRTQPTQTAIAKALGLAKSRITALKKAGCPMNSIEAAKAWYARNIRKKKVYRPGTDPVFEKAERECNLLWAKMIAEGEPEIPDDWLKIDFDDAALEIPDEWLKIDDDLVDDAALDWAGDFLEKGGTDQIPGDDAEKTVQELAEFQKSHKKTMM